MLPFLVLIAATITVRTMGAAGVRALDTWPKSLRLDLFVMFAVTASAHWGKRRPDLIAMVPTVFRRADLMVTITGILEIVGAAGLLLPVTAPIAAVCLIVLLIVIFPANVRASRQHLTIGERQATALPLRALLQIVFIAALVVAGFPRAFGLPAR